MILLIMTMIVQPEKRKEIHQTLLSLIGPNESVFGNLSYGIFCDIENENRFKLISLWENDQSLDYHMKSERFSVLLGTKSLLSEPQTIQIFRSSVYAAAPCV